MELPGATEEVRLPALERTLDLNSPRLVSAQLFEAIRLTDFCLVDLTTARPNVFFELGVRLAASRLLSRCVVHRSSCLPSRSWWKGTSSSASLPAYPKTRAQSPLGGLPAAGVYDIAWRHAVDR